MSLFQRIEQSLYFFRDSIWEFPNLIFFAPDSLVRGSFAIYKKGRPLSSLIATFMLFIIISVLVLNNVGAFFVFRQDTLIEGVVMGVDDNGEIQHINRVNPLIPTNVELEKDLIDIVYQELVKVDQAGDVVPVLADYFTIEEGKTYRFKIKPNQKWYDGTDVSVNDVVETFNLLKLLEAKPETSTLYSRAAAKMDLKVIDDLSFEVSLKSVIPNFFEAMSFKILPAHLISDMNPYNITSSDPILNRRPLGTGPYQLATVENGVIDLIENKYSSEKNPSISHIRFKLYKDEKTAVEALKSGQIHSLARVSTNYLRELEKYPQFEVIKSNIIYNQYYGIYFNLGENGPSFLKDIKVRQAISSAVNRKEIIDSLYGYGEEAVGPIPLSSYAYTDTPRFGFDKAKAIKLLEDDGWKLNADGLREKDGTQLSFRMILVESQDRISNAEVIRKDLADVGINLIIDAKNKDTVVNDHIIPRDFDTLLYGVQTFISPDRYELFHSSQIQHPGLNISSYVSAEKVLSVVGNKTQKIPEVDDALDDARKILTESGRKRRYQDFQRIVNNEVPVVFLFHPIEGYIVNRRVKNVELTHINSIDQRFTSIKNWVISLD